MSPPLSLLCKLVLWHRPVVQLVEQTPSEQTVLASNLTQSTVFIIISNVLNKINQKIIIKKLYLREVPGA